MEWVITFIIIVIASTVQVSTGFGFAILAVPLLIMVHNTHQAIVLSNVLSLVSALVLLPRVRQEIDRPLLKRLFIGCLLGLPLGVLVFSHVPAFWLEIAVGVTIILLIVCMLAGISLPLGRGRRIGAMAGVMATSIGMPGPPIVLFLASLHTEKGAFRGTTIAFYCLLYPFTLLLQFLTGHVEAVMVPHMLLMLPAIFIGQVIGSALYGKINERMFRKVIYVLLIVSAVNSMLHSFGIML